jgi:hypothetical protein
MNADELGELIRFVFIDLMGYSIDIEYYVDKPNSDEVSFHITRGTDDAFDITIAKN